MLDVALGCWFSVASLPGFSTHPGPLLASDLSLAGLLTRCFPLLPWNFSYAEHPVTCSPVPGCVCPERCVTDCLLLQKRTSVSFCHPSVLLSPKQAAVFFLQIQMMFLPPPEQALVCFFQKDLPPPPKQALFFFVSDRSLSAAEVDFSFLVSEFSSPVEVDFSFLVSEFSSPVEVDFSFLVSEFSSPVEVDFSYLVSEFSSPVEVDFSFLVSEFLSLVGVDLTCLVSGRFPSTVSLSLGSSAGVVRCEEPTSAPGFPSSFPEFWPLEVGMVRSCLGMKVWLCCHA